MAILNVILVKLFFYLLSSFKQGKLSFKLGILLFKSSNNNPRVHGLISFNIIFN